MVRAARRRLPTDLIDRINNKLQIDWFLWAIWRDFDNRVVKHFATQFVCVFMDIYKYFFPHSLLLDAKFGYYALDWYKARLWLLLSFCCCRHNGWQYFLFSFCETHWKPNSAEPKNYLIFIGWQIITKYLTRSSYFNALCTCAKKLIWKYTT